LYSFPPAQAEAARPDADPFATRRSASPEIESRHGFQIVPPVDILGDSLLAVFPRSCSTVPDTFDPYREALVMETDTIWPAEFADVPPAERRRLEEKLHADPKACAHLDYVRTHTGFCRQITVTNDDVQRLSS
jgi:hypothetical protein